MKVVRYRTEAGLIGDTGDVFHLSKIKYDADTITPAGFYQLYWAHIIKLTSQAGETIQWNNNHLLAQDEIIGAAFDDHILYSVIALIDPHLTV